MYRYELFSQEQQMLPSFIPFVFITVLIRHGTGSTRAAGTFNRRFHVHISMLEPSRFAACTYVMLISHGKGALMVSHNIGCLSSNYAYWLNGFLS